MSMDYIRKHYGLEIKRGTDVLINTPRAGKIKGVVAEAKGARIRIKLIGLPKHPIWTYHPTDDSIEYLAT